MRLAERTFQAWAPDAGIWSAWAKPVLFAHLDGAVELAAAAPADELPAAGPAIAALPEADGRSVVVVDLPGVQSVSAGLLLARLGYRPVPLFNAVPPPAPQPPDSPRAAAVVDVASIMAALVAGAEGLATLHLPVDAPPAFLLDANRRTGGATVVRLEPGEFDNRSVSLTTDFPSGNLLRSRGIERAIVLQVTASQPQADLCHTLLAWQSGGGIRIEIQPADSTAPPQPATIRRPPWFGMLWQRFLATLGLRRHPLGGFGGVLPTPTAG
jgi:hypothetical protein